MHKRRNKLLSALLSIIIFTTCIIVCYSENYTNDDYPQTGLIVNQKNIENLAQYMDYDFAPLAVLPEAVDNTQSFPTPGDQGNQESCTAWAIGYALKSQQETMKRNWTANTTTHNFSPAFIFNSLKKGSNTGLDIIDALEFLQTNGVCPLSYFAYDDTDCATQPNNIQSAAARLYKIDSFSGVHGLTNLKSKIANGEGVVIGITLYTDFYTLNSFNPIYDNLNGAAGSDHTICLIGYDDNMGDNGAFKFINSWGTDSQLGGYGWVSYDLIMDNRVNLYGAGVGFVINVSANDNYVMGDVTGDGKITASDARLALRFSSMLEAYTPEQYVLGDVDGDSLLTAADARNIMQYSSGTLTKLPIYE